MRAVTLALTFLVVSHALVGLAQSAAVTQEGKLDVPLVGASSAQAGGKIYIFGGRDPTDQYHSSVRMYDPATRTVTRVAEFPTPVGGPAVGGSAGRYSGTAVAFGSKIYFFGGTQITMIDISSPPDGRPDPIPRAVRDIFEFDPATNELRKLRDELPVGTWGMAGAATPSAIYLFGGFTFDYGNIPATGRHDTVLRFDPNAAEGDRVDELQTRLPYGVQDAAAAVIGRRIYIMGGLGDHNPETNPCPSYSYFNPDTNRQETAQTEVCITKRIMSFDPTFGSEFALGVAGELPYRAQFVHAAVVNDKAYVAGALLSDGTAASSILEISADRAGTPSARVLTPALPNGTFGQSVSTDGQTILVAGGRVGGIRELIDSIVRLDPRPTPPWAPRAASASDITGGVRLTWEAPTYNGDAVVTGYRVYRAPIGGVEAQLTETTQLSYDDTSVRPGTEYIWRIAAVNTVGEGTQSARVTRASSVTVPGPVASFSAFPGNQVVVLRWNAPEESGGSNLTGYRIVRDGQIIASPPADRTEYTDTTVQNERTYTYQVRATNSRGDGRASESVTVTPVAVPSPPGNVAAEVVATDAASAVRITWLAPAEPVSKFVVFRSALPGRPGVIVGNATQTDTAFTDTSVERGRTYYYSVASENNVGRSPPSREEQVALVRKPGSPTEVTAVGLEGEVRVSWAPPIDTGDAPASALRYYVSRQGGGASRAIIVKTDIEGTVYADRAVTAGQSYTYTVTTLNPMLSDPSEPASATPKAVLNKAPEALLSILPPLTTAGFPVELDASQSADLDGTIRTYLFDFGDGTDFVRTTTPTIQHEYAFNGTFSATVIVTDDRGVDSAPASAQVIVGEVVSREVDSGLPGRVPSPTNGQRPGSETPDVPGPSAALLLVAVAAVALALSRRHRVR